MSVQGQDRGVLWEGKGTSSLAKQAWTNCGRDWGDVQEWFRLLGILQHILQKTKSMCLVMFVLLSDWNWVCPWKGAGKYLGILPWRGQVASGKWKFSLCACMPEVKSEPCVFHVKVIWEFFSISLIYSRYFQGRNLPWRAHFGWTAMTQHRFLSAL